MSAGRDPRHVRLASLPIPKFQFAIEKLPDRRKDPAGSLVWEQWCFFFRTRGLAPPGVARPCNPCQEKVDCRRFRLNFALEIEKILCYDWFPTKGSRKREKG